MENRLVRSIVALVAALGIPSGMLAQTPLRQAQGGEQSRTAARPGAARTQSRIQTAAGAPDLSGVWLVQPPFTFSREEPPMTPWAEVQYKARTSGTTVFGSPGSGYKDVSSPENINPIYLCNPYGIPRVYLDPHPFKIISTTSGEIIFLLETGNMFREIYMDGRAHPPDPTWFGHSIGKWDQDTLVIDTVGFNDKTWLDQRGHPHSEALHTVERWRRMDPDTLQLDITIEDPKAYTKAWSGRNIFKSKPWDIGESICTIGNEINYEKKAVLPLGGTGAFEQPGK